MSGTVTGSTPRPLSHKSPELDRQLLAAAELIRQHQRFVVTAHHGPDGDAMGSTLGLTQVLREMGKQATPFNKDGVPYSFTFLPGADDLVTHPAELPSAVDVAFVLDCSSLERVHPELSFDRTQTRIVCVDHHETIDDGFDVFVHDVGASSVGELIYRLLVTLDWPLSPPVADCLFTSIQTDTGSFRYSSTSPDALDAAAELVKAGVNVWEISSAVYENHPLGRIQLLGEVLQTLKLSSCGRLAFLTVTQEMYRRTGTGPEMLDGFINHARGIEGVEAAVQLREVGDGKYRVSFRSRGRINVAKVAEKFGGGGHHNAAGCTVEGSAEAVMSRITEELDDALAA